MARALARAQLEAVGFDDLNKLRPEPGREAIGDFIGERAHEIGLRMALGAQPAQVLGLVLRQAMVLSFIGVGIGVASSFAATPLLAEFLYGVKAHDMLTVVLVSLLLVAVTFVASYVPARQATKIDPMRTLRHE